MNIVDFPSDTIDFLRRRILCHRRSRRPQDVRFWTLSKMVRT